MSLLCVGLGGVWGWAGWTDRTDGTDGTDGTGWTTWTTLACWMGKEIAGCFFLCVVCCLCVGYNGWDGGLGHRQSLL